MIDGQARVSASGQSAARARGAKMGRPPKLAGRQKKEAIERRDYGDETLVEIGRGYNVSGSAISKLAP